MEDNVVSSTLTKLQIAEQILHMMPKQAHEKKEISYDDKLIRDHINQGGTLMEYPVVGKDFILTDLMKRLDERKIPYALVRLDNGLTILTGRSCDENQIHEAVEEIKSQYMQTKDPVTGVMLNPVTEVKKGTLNNLVRDDLSRVNMLSGLDPAEGKLLTEELRLRGVVFATDEKDGLNYYFSSKDRDKVSIAYAKVNATLSGVSGSFERDRVNISLATMDKARKMLTKENEEAAEAGGALHESFYVVSRTNPKNRIEVTEKGMAHDLYKNGKITHTYRYADRAHPDFMAAFGVELAAIKEPVIMKKDDYDRLKDDPYTMEEAMEKLMDKPMYEKNDALRAYHEKLILGAYEKALSHREKLGKMSIESERQDINAILNAPMDEKPQMIADFVCGKELSNAEYNQILEALEGMGEPDLAYALDRLNENVKVYEDARYFIREYEFSPEELEKSKEDIFNEVETPTAATREYELEVSEELGDD